MKSKILVISLILMMITSSFSFAETVDFEDLVDTMIENNTALRSIEMNIEKMHFTSEKANLDSKLMAKSIDDIKFIYIKEYKPKGDALQGMYYVRDIAPLLTDKSINDLRNTYTETKVSMTTVLKQLVLGVQNADKAYKLTVEKNDYYIAQYEAAKLKKSLGLVTDNDVKDAEITMLRNQSSMNGKKNELDIAHLQLNKHLGLPTYTRLDCDFSLYYIDPLLTEEKYVSMALEYRKEILDIQANIDMANKEIEHLEGHEDYRYARNVLDKKQDQQDNIAKYNLQLLEAKAFVEKDIRLAFNALETYRNSIHKLKNSLEEQEQTYRELTAQYEVGNITPLQLKQSEFVVTELKNQLEALEYNYAINLEKFYHAVEYGPAYNGGSLK